MTARERSTMATPTTHARDFEGWVADEIRNLVCNDAGNRLDRLDGSAIFDEPLVGFVAGDDPIFARLKEVIGPFHLTPREALLTKAEQRSVAPDCVEEDGVVSYVLPISSATRKENARMKDRPSRRWAHTRLFGEEFNRAVQTHLVRVLEEQGYLAVAPELEESLFRMFVDEKVGWTSRWSQRHVAFAAGLGTFGLSDALITRAGKAHRVGSVVVNRALDSPPRTDDIHRDCLSYQGIICRICMKRCPAEAITEEGHDKARCAEFVLKQFPVVQKEYGIDIYGCGLCQTRVPCEGRIPRAGDIE
jgi:epoxyqueuosine reductase QueG